ncbi:MAG: hypothetical protein WD058_02585 [Dehalococcoidia bacterium]
MQEGPHSASRDVEERPLDERSRGNRWAKALGFGLTVGAAGGALVWGRRRRTR